MKKYSLLLFLITNCSCLHAMYYYSSHTLTVNTCVTYAANNPEIYTGCSPGVSSYNFYANSRNLAVNDNVWFRSMVSYGCSDKEFCDLTPGEIQCVEDPNAEGCEESEICQHTPTLYPQETPYSPPSGWYSFSKDGINYIYQCPQGTISIEISVNGYPHCNVVGSNSAACFSSPNNPGNGQQCGDDKVAGNPVFMGTGNKYQVETDYRQAFPSSLSFVRYYNASSSTSNGGWSHSYSRHIITNTVNGFQYVWVVRDDGKTSLLTPDASPNSWSSSSAPQYKMQLIGPVWELTINSNQTEKYTSVNGHGVIDSLTTLSGKNVIFDYEFPDPNNSLERRLKTITDITHGGILQLEYYTTSPGDGQLKKIIVPGGDEVLYTYIDTDFSGVESQLLEKVFYPGITNPRIYVYEPAATAVFPNQLIAIIDENSVQYATWTYNADGQAISSTHNSGAEQTTIEYIDANNVKTTNALGKQTTYTFETIQSRRKVTTVQGVASTNCAAANKNYTYDANGFISSKTDWENNTTSFVRNSRGLPTERKEGVGTSEERTINTEWHASLHKPTKIIETGKTTEYTYDANGLLTSSKIIDTTIPNGPESLTTYTYTSLGLTETVDGSLLGTSDTTTYEYDATGRMTKIINALNQEIQITTYNSRQLPTEIIDANGVVSQLDYYYHGWLKSKRVKHPTDTSGAQDAITTYTYDNVGLLTQITLPDNRFIQYTYNDARYLTAIENNAGERIEYTVNNMGSILQVDVKNAGSTLVKTQSKLYDELNRLMTIIDSRGKQLDLVYDKNSQLTDSTETQGFEPQVTQQFYDSLQRLTTSRDAMSDGTNNNDTLYNYDDRDNLVSVQDAKGLSTHYIYDGLDRLKQLQSPDTGTANYDYDLAGNRTQQTDARGVIINYVYDALNRLTQTNYPADPSRNVTYSYDDTVNGNFGIGRLTKIESSNHVISYKYDHRGNVIETNKQMGPVNVTTAYAYNLADIRTAVTYPDGQIISLVTNNLGQISEVQKDMTPVISNIQYLPFGGHQSMDLSNGLSMVRSFDQDYRLTSHQVQDAQSANYISDTYTYDDVGNISQITDFVYPVLSQVFAYDKVNRVTGAQSEYGTIYYDYDKVGNRLGRTTWLDSTWYIDEIYSYESTSHHLLSVTNEIYIFGFDYDANGNLKQETRQNGLIVNLEYGENNRLEAVTPQGGQ